MWLWGATNQAKGLGMCKRPEEWPLWVNTRLSELRSWTGRGSPRASGSGQPGSWGLLCRAPLSSPMPNSWLPFIWPFHLTDPGGRRLMAARPSVWASNTTQIANPGRGCALFPHVGRNTAPGGRADRPRSPPGTLAGPSCFLRVAHLHSRQDGSGAVLPGSRSWDPLAIRAAGPAVSSGGHSAGPHTTGSAGWAEGAFILCRNVHVLCCEAMPLVFKLGRPISQQR